MKRVLLTSHKFFPEHRAGTEVLTLKIAQELKRRGYEVLVVACDPPDLDASRKVEHECEGDTRDYIYEEIPVHIVGEALRLRGADFFTEYYHPLIKEHFSKLLAEFKPDLVQIVHAQNLSASIIEASQEASVPVVFYSTDFWFVCPIVQLKRPDGQVCRGPGPMALKCLDCYTPRLFPGKAEVARAFEQKYGTLGQLLKTMPPVVRNLSASGLAATFAAVKAPQAISATLKRPMVLKNLANKVQKIMVPTGLMRDIFVENGINSQLIKHVPFGIDTTKLVNHQAKIPSEVLRIGFIGTFFEHKGVDLLINAFLELPTTPPSVLKLYGDPGQFPEYFAKLKALAGKNKERSGDIHFLGTFPNDQLGSIFEELDVLVVPSRWYENTPLVMQSALATRTPLIVTDLGGMSELVKDGENGLLFKLNDYHSLAQKLALVLNKRSELTKYMSNIKPERTVADMVNDIESVYTTVMKTATRS
ncbi:MAG: glycosyltransferase [Candidatus Obscuribacter sp.]|nr:glycosyltransferase [Candidatus Obscuribacter sp.]